MSDLSDLADAIDTASDAGDEARLRELGDDCRKRLTAAEGQERVLLRYYESNTYGAIISAHHRNPDYTWSWKQPDGVLNILSLRQAINEPAFQNCNPILACQIRTNLANRLSAFGRPAAASEQWTQVLRTIPEFAKALASRAEALAHYAGTLYDHNHASIMLAAARSSFDAALDDRAFWESDDRASVAPTLVGQYKQIASHLDRIGYCETYDLNQWSLGSSEDERSYRHWCLTERLFLNPLNDAYTDSVAATDVLHLPSHTYRITEVPRFPAYYNLLKQEYVSARYQLYRAIHEGDPDFLMRDVLMLDTGENQVLGHYTESLRSAFRSSYAIFDKIGLFLNDYFQIALRAKDVTFRRVWTERPKGASVEIRPVFTNRQNWPLRGLYFLSKDLFDQPFRDVSEPDAKDLATLRNQLEHRFLSFQRVTTEANTDVHRFIPIADFENKVLRLLKMAREALIYLSLAMHREERLRRPIAEDSGTVQFSVEPWPIESFSRH